MQLHETMCDIQQVTESGFRCALLLPSTFLTENGAERQKGTWNNSLLAAPVPNVWHLSGFLFLLAAAEMMATESSGDVYLRKAQQVMTSKHLEMCSCNF